MDNFIIRRASVADVPFLVDTIIEAEKSGTERLSYCTIFGLTEEEARKFIRLMLLEEVDNCELSISSFLLAEKNGFPVAAVSAWIEELEGIPSSILKGNLLSYTLPMSFMKNASGLSSLIRDLHIESSPGSIQVGLVYVAEGNRGLNLAGMLIEKQIALLQDSRSTIEDVYVQVFAANAKAIRAYQKVGFEIIYEKKSFHGEILRYLPSDSKVLMKRKIKPK